MIQADLIIEGAAELLTLRGHEGRVFSVAFSPDGRRVMTESNDEGTALPGRDQPGLPEHEDDNGISPIYVLEAHADPLFEISLVVLLDEVRNDFAVCLRSENVPLVAKLPL